jgi:cytoplasmic iron level regulating protein YaaA (DUF328/UPF0246 family)
VLILLPPSESKAAGGRGRPVDLATLSFPELTTARSRVLDGLVALCEDRSLAATALGLGPTRDGEVARNALLRRAPARVAAQLYTGVLYDALDCDTLPPAAMKLLARSTVIFSGLWGAVRLRDRIPAYRLPIGVSLPDLGGLGAYWRTHLPSAMSAAAGEQLVIDLRSGAYAPMWALPPRSARIRVLHERVVGGQLKRTVVSHFNKATKGRMVRDLMIAGARPKTVPALINVLRELGYSVEPGEREGQLDVVVAEL